jgi:hypothetical protein
MSTLAEVLVVVTVQLYLTKPPVGTFTVAGAGDSVQVPPPLKAAASVEKLDTASPASKDNVYVPIGSEEAVVKLVVSAPALPVIPVTIFKLPRPE